MSGRSSYDLSTCLILEFETAMAVRSGGGGSSGSDGGVGGDNNMHRTEWLFGGTDRLRNLKRFLADCHDAMGVHIVAWSETLSAERIRELLTRVKLGEFFDETVDHASVLRLATAMPVDDSNVQQPPVMVRTALRRFMDLRALKTEAVVFVGDHSRRRLGGGRPRLETLCHAVQVSPRLMEWLSRTCDALGWTLAEVPFTDTTDDEDEEEDEEDDDENK